MDLADQLSAFFATRDDVAAAWLFGSQARGTARKDSDVDVAVLLKREPPRTLLGLPTELAYDLEETLRGRRIDLVVVNRASADFVHRVLRDGILLAERDKTARVRFEVKKRNEYFDLLPMLRRIRAAR